MKVWLTSVTLLIAGGAVAQEDGFGGLLGLYDPDRLARSEMVLSCFDAASDPSQIDACVGVSVPGCLTKANAADQQAPGRCWRSEADTWLALAMTLAIESDAEEVNSNKAIARMWDWEIATVESCGPQTLEAGENSVGTVEQAKCWAQAAAQRSHQMINTPKE